MPLSLEITGVSPTGKLFVEEDDGTCVSGFIAAVVFFSVCMGFV
jgi:hypothetical protein